MLIRNCFLRLLLDPMAGDLAGGGGAPIETPDVAPENGGPERNFDAPVSDPGPSPATSAPAPVAADPNVAAGTPTQTPVEYQSIREAATRAGYRVPQGIEDDQAFFSHLLDQARQAQQSNVYAQLGQQLAPQAAGIHQYLAQQRTQQATPTRQPWEAPEFNPQWGSMVIQDEATGLFYGKPGTPHEIVNKVNAYATYKAEYDRDPAKFMNQMVEHKAREIAQTTFREQFEAQARTATVSQIVAENRDWLYQKDANGQPVVGYNQQYVPTVVGARYIHHLQAIKAAGVTDPRTQDRFAKDQVRGEIAIQHYQSQQAAAAQAANPQTAAAVGLANVNPLQATTTEQRRLNPAATEPTGTCKSLGEMLREEMAAQGVTDADFANLGG